MNRNEENFDQNTQKIYKSTTLDPNLFLSHLQVRKLLSKKFFCLEILSF